MTGLPSSCDDEVAGLDAGLGRRRVVDRRDHLDHPVLHRDLDAEPAELALGLDLHVVPFLGIDVARMRIERGEHALDRGFDELLVRDRLDVGRADLLEHVAEQVQLLIGAVRRCSIARPPRSATEKRRQERLPSAKFCVSSCHSTLLSLLPSQGAGSIGRPSRRSSI